jgi:hypothetical protein
MRIGRNNSVHAFVAAREGMLSFCLHAGSGWCPSALFDSSVEKKRPHTMKRQLWATLSSVVILLAGAGSALAQASVTTDQSDYPPGSTVYITGAGFQPGETVQLQVLRIDIPENTGAEHDPWPVTADANGGFEATWFVAFDELGATLQLTATGLTSGRIAQTTFTDSKTLAVAFSGAGRGTVTSSPAGISTAYTNSTRTGTYQVSFNNYEVVTLTASPGSDSRVGQWTIPSGFQVTAGGQPGDTTCTFNLNNNAGTVAVRLDLRPGAKLTFTTQPANSTAGGTMASVVVQVQDVNGNNVASNNVPITVTLSSGSFAGGSTTTVTSDSTGKSTFSNLIINTAGSYTMTALASGIGAGMTSGTSSSFNVMAAAATKLAFTTSPSGATAGNAFTTQPVVKTQDAYGNDSTVGLGSSVPVTIAIKAGTGTLQGTTAYNIGTSQGNGTITGSGLRIDQSGSFTLSATASGLTEGVSSSFTVPNAAPVALAKTFTRGAGASLKISKTDLLAGATDANNDTLSVSAVQNPSAGGATVTAPAGSWVFYLPNSAGDGDTFTYTVSDGHGGTDTKTVTVQVVNQGGTAQNVSYDAGGVTVIFAGIPGQTYDVQRSANPGFTTPAVMTITQAPSAGVFSYRDSNPGNPSSYYRLKRH